jgi:cytochrome P450
MPTDTLTTPDRARAEAYAMPLDQIDVTKPRLFQDDSIGHYFERLRREDPVHHHSNDFYGPYWSVTKYQDIMHVDTHHGIYSSDWSHGGIGLYDAPLESRYQMFIAMDPPKHDEQRKTVSPIVAPGNLASACSTLCRATRPSTGSTGCRSNSPRRCWPRCSTSRSRTAAC